MKKIIIMLSILIISAGCNMGGNTPEDKVKAYLERYIKNDAQIMTQLDEFVEEQEYTLENKELYKDVLEKQYKDLKYEIDDVEKEDSSALVTVKITVYDLFKIQKEADSYLRTNEEEFMKDEELDEDKYTEYQLNEMKMNTDTVDHTIVFIVNKVGNEWVVDNLSPVDLEKLHGIYNYEED